MLCPDSKPPLNGTILLSKANTEKSNLGTFTFPFLPRLLVFSFEA